MVTADLHIAERTDVMRNESDQQADAEKGDEEADRGQEKSSMRTLRNPLVNEQP